MTNTIGAMQGWGRLTLASIFEFPEESALKSPVLTLATVAVPLASMLRQLTMARKAGNGFLPRSEAGTEGWLASTSPRTFRRR